jgi:hypothetical protein
VYENKFKCSYYLLIGNKTAVLEIVKIVMVPFVFITHPKQLKISDLKIIIKSYFICCFFKSFSNHAFLGLNALIIFRDTNRVQTLGYFPFTTTCKVVGLETVFKQLVGCEMFT